MGADICDIKFGTFLIVVFIIDLDADGLYCSMTNRASGVYRSIYISDREWVLQGSKS